MNDCSFTRRKIWKNQTSNCRVLYLLFSKINLLFLEGQYSILMHKGHLFSIPSVPHYSLGSVPHISLLRNVLKKELPGRLKTRME